MEDNAAENVSENPLYTYTIYIIYRVTDHSADNVTFPRHFPDSLLHSSAALGMLCYSYHAATSTKYLYGHKYAANNKQFQATFP